MRRLAVLALLMALAALPALGETRLMVISDTHYLAPALYEDGELFLRALRRGDGKITHRGEELMSALVEEVRAQRPDALLVTGDLSFNGEKQSHQALAQWFAEIEALGVPVWVIPGNHDINVASAASYAGNVYAGTDAVDAAGFSAIYADFLLPASGGAGLSYVARVNDELWVAMTDVAFYEPMAQTFGLFTAGHETFLAGALAEAGAAGVQVITATHHSLVEHTSFSRDSYLMFGHEAMQALALEHGVRLNLSGHLHIQHLAASGSLTDAATAAFCVWPHRYGLVTLTDDGRLIYEARSLSEKGLPEGFLEESREWFAGITREKTLEGLGDSPRTEEERAQMADYAARFNLAYFSGTWSPEDPAWRTDAGYTLWQEENSAFGQYLRLVMSQAAGSHLYAELP